MNKSRKTILAPATNHPEIIKQTLKDKVALLGTSILPFNVYLDQFNHDKQDKNTKFALAYQRIQQVKDQCAIMANSLVYPDIVSQLISFTMDCVRYGIDYNSLPLTNQKEKDVALIIQAIWPLYQSTPHLAMLKEHVSDASDVIIYPFNHTIAQKEMLDYLRSVGASFASLPLQQSTSSHVFYALNHAKEAEAIAQHLLKNENQSTLLVVCETGSLFTMLNAALNRYNLTYSDDISTSKPLLVDQFLALYHLLNTQSIEYVKECIHNGVFKVKNPSAFLNYVRLLNLSFNDLDKPFTHYHDYQDWKILSEMDIHNLLVLEKDAEKDRESILQILRPMLDNPIIACFDYFAQTFSFMDLSNQQALLSIKDIIEQLTLLEMDNELFEIVFVYLTSLITSQPRNEKRNIHITSLANYYQPGFDQVIIVGANQQNYPGFSKHNGIIDEQYLSKTAYPKLEDRLIFHINQLQPLTSIAPQVIVSYVTSTFDGKVMAPAYELIDQIASDKKPWKLQTFGKEYVRNYTLDPSLSQALFLKDNALYGSVSSFEVFYHCQYRYFLKSGMKLSENDPEPILVALIGSISHKIVESLTQINAKEYATLSDQQLYEHIAYYFSDLHMIYPNQSHYWDFIADRLKVQLSLALKRLNAMEKDTSFTFNQAEKVFTVMWTLPNDINLFLKGFIDRIDTTSDFFRIVDYKSSEKNLSKSLFKAGLQLQLLTYLIVASKEMDKKPSGAFYYSFLNKNIETSTYKLTRGKVISLSYADAIESFYKDHKLNGWFVDEDGSMYESDWHIKHMSKSKKVTKGGLFDLDKIEAYLLNLYTNLSEQLQQGNIDRNPIAGACDYCEFKHICVFKGSYRKITAFDEENTLKQGDDDAREE